MSVFIRGIGLTKVREAWEKGIDDLAVKAAWEAIDDAEMELEDIDKVYISSALAEQLQNQRNLGSKVLDAIGLYEKPVINVNNGGASGGIAIHLAAQDVKTTSDNVLVLGVEKLKDTLWSDLLQARVQEESWEYLGRMGATNSGIAGMLLRLYMKEYNAEHEGIAKMVELSHNHACNAPHAEYPFPVSVDKVLKSPTVASPLKLFELAGIGDGAAATIISKERGEVELVASEITSDKFMFFERENMLTLEGVQECAKKVYQKAGISVNDLDVAEIYDRSSIMGVLELEALGLAETGKGHSNLKEEEFTLSSETAVNTFGGLKARGNPVGATGIYQVAEGVKQLEGKSGENQVEDAEFALTLGLNGLGNHVIINLLKRRKGSEKND